MKALLICLGFCLAACNEVSVDAINAPLENKIGDALRGEIIFAAREGGHCILCHQVESLTAEFQGNVGPDLTYVSSRLTPAQMRLRIVDYDSVKPGTTMPPYYRKDNLNQVGGDYVGQTLLSAQDIEDIIAYLASLKESG